ncbi:helicase-exonuclease AddAB subunit AddA [Clostridium tagluense]|uniref:helicase-exonuclease AddAB subunit AddA n=1 Tax=Clostridium tagluense TaxID=360422 RepID=UPI001CF546F1|nr:helicase-exonuclease AddAB subunit AddA [Clostridium tagluense]MCB2310512.1 helicase-exonuclease AddAB subunit AddA [Clostridium tagluense]MCB2315322.1 helicase-exonuclease AddAB subunit AddA [Clostridium tagluense]MCB2320173.1 helicase-exonuclease AddAB subunit AddA [Clostridium tagluense]MCB2325064.1 helicase-exonuclease AddAB subunit AddA [Clostridium tagluense]MCB2329916.1 helicase-exonuclease AddAB subunit AddA [Clostridium tagluense]
MDKDISEIKQVEKKVSWTEDQQKAITTRDCNILVAAAAGSGKTAVLVERIIKIVTDEERPTDIDKLLVVTFTNAAASEMRERIAQAISKELHKNPKSKLLQRQLTLLNKSSITTIHSFCLEVIRNNFHIVDLDPNFRIADTTEAVLLKQEALEELFEERYVSIVEDQMDQAKEGNQEWENGLEENSSSKLVQAPSFEQENSFLNLVESYSNNKEDLGLQAIVLSLYNFAMSSTDPAKWLLDAAEDFNIKEGYSLSDTPWAAVLIEDIKIELQGIEKVMIKALKIIEGNEAIALYFEVFKGDLEIISDLLSASKNSFNNLAGTIENLSFQKLPSIKACKDKEKQKAVQDIRNKVKKQLQELGQQVMNANSETALEDIKKLYPQMMALSQLVIDLEEKYTQKKKERSIIDFNDFEHFCLYILMQRNEKGEVVLGLDGKPEPSSVALQLRNKYEEILIDEYQDSNMVQETLLNIISREKIGAPNVFMVGDVKQSIYRFRQARPELFLGKYSSYEKVEGAKTRKITLYKNFRSREPVINAVNYIFKGIMCKNIGDLDYTDEEALNLGAFFEELKEPGVVGGAVELHLIEKDVIDISEENTEVEDENQSKDSEDQDASKSSEEETPTNIQLEARIVAKRIKELMLHDGCKAFKIYDKNIKAYRNVDYKDIVILLRATSNWAPSFLEELKLEGIPVYADTGTGYFNTIEIQIIMSLLQIIDNPRQDIPMLSVLRSPIGGFTSEELVDMRIGQREISFYEAMVNFSDAKETEQNESIAQKLNKFLKKLNHFREICKYMPIDEFIWYLYTDTGYYGYIGAMPGGVQRQANLRVLFQRARQYAETSYKGLFNFINFINKLKISSGDMGSAKTLGENENVVRIMSIHKSKGLEFPVVFLSGTGKNFNLMDINKSILFHHDLGYGPDFVDPLRRISYPTVLKQALRKKIKIESLSEEMRVLYVAFTRAKEKLIITGSIKNIEKNIGRMSFSLEENTEKLGEYEILKAKSYLDWIVPSVIRHADGKMLRKLIGIEDDNVNLLEHPARFRVRLWNRDDIVKIQDAQEETLVSTQEKLIMLQEKITDEKNMAEIEKRLGFIYKYEMSTKMPTVLTVTELKRKVNVELAEGTSENMYVPKLISKPRFLEELKGLTPAEKGTAMHAVVQRLDLNKVSTTSEIEAQIRIYIEKLLLSKEEGKAVRAAKLVKLFKTELGARMVKAYGLDLLKREVPFHMEINSTDIYKNLPTDIYGEEKIILQGIIDCYFEENGEIILVDYKTDSVKNGDTDELIEKYKPQLDYYARALKATLGKTVKESYLYLFSIDEALRVK